MRRMLAVLLIVVLILCCGVSASAAGITLVNSVGGDVTVLSGSLLTEGGYVQLQANARTAEGYVFDHWEFTTLVGGALINETSTTNPENFYVYGRTVVPVFKKTASTGSGLPSASALFGKKYTITYNPGAYGSGLPWPIEWDREQVNLAGQLYTRTGYTQTGWSRIDGGAKTYNLSEKIILNQDMTLYPYWEAVTKELYLTVLQSGYGSIQLSGTTVYNGWRGKLLPGQSYTFVFMPGQDQYVYSLFLGGKYRSMQQWNRFMVTYEMMEGHDQTLQVRFDSVYNSPKTGDESNLGLWLALGGVSLAGIVILFIKKKKCKRKSCRRIERQAIN